MKRPKLFGLGKYWLFCRDFSVAGWRIRRCRAPWLGGGRDPGRGRRRGGCAVRGTQVCLPCLKDLKDNYVARKGKQQSLWEGKPVGGQ